MSEDAFALMQSLIVNIWRFMTSWKVPGFNFTPAQLLMFSLLFPVILRFVFDFLSVSVDTHQYSDNDHYWAQVKRRK